MPRGKYWLKIYKVRYGVNDPYTTYLSIGAPDQLTDDQDNAVKGIKNGDPVSSSVVTILQNETFEKDFPMRENDVYFATLERLN